MRTRRTPIGDAWATYAERVLPAGASDVQRQETKRAFYAGADGMLTSLLRLFGEGDEPTPEDLDLMQDVQDEIKAFVQEVLRGEA